MLSEFHAATPIEVYTITPGDYFRWVAAWTVVTLLAVGFAAWVFLPRGEDDGASTPVETDSPESAETVELPRRRSGLRTAPTIHAPQYHRPSDDATVVIERVETRR